MKHLKKNNAMTMIEITIALTILVCALIPLSRMSSGNAVKVIETEKIQMAERILESIKSEIMALPFKRFYERVDKEKGNGPFNLSDGFYPIGLSKVLEVQKQYKDFKVIGSWGFVIRENKPDKTMIQTDVTCSFDRGVNSSPIIRRKSFLIIKP